MNLTHLEAIALVQKVAFGLREREADAVEVAVIPPFTSIRSVQTLIDGDKLSLVFGAQDVSAHTSGAYTGEVVGRHAGQARLHLCRSSATASVASTTREDDAVVAAKVRAAYAQRADPDPVRRGAESVREDQRHVEHVLDSLTGCARRGPRRTHRGAHGHLVIAYEPVWAIGTGKTATCDDAQEMCAALRGRLAELISPELRQRTRVLYGGSVKASNAAELMAEPDVDGALVGGASLIAEDFCGIVRGALPAGAAGGSRRLVTSALRLLDESAAQATSRAACPHGSPCADDYPADGDRVAAGLFLERLRSGPRSAAVRGVPRAA